MKCQRCLTLNGGSDSVCGSCGLPLARPKVNAIVPFWGIFFAIACVMIPVLTLGGGIPLVLGLGGAGGCVKASSLAGRSLALRLLLCIGITVFVWLMFIGLLTPLVHKSR
jgi:hypothetical protein